jgi:hypothetical protein
MRCRLAKGHGTESVRRDLGRDRGSRRRLSDLAATRDRALRSREGLSEWTDALRSVHEALRETRDALRQYEQAGDFGARFVALARSLAYASDRRDHLRREINERMAAARREK